MEHQSGKSKLGEVIFRQKLVNQHLGKGSFFKGQPNQKQIIDLLHQRVVNSRRIFADLTQKNISLSPFLEIGAEKGQRAALLASEFNAQGFALDISYESLKSAKFFAKKLNLKKLPILVCADAENLPFATSSIPFVFAFETLHHFPKPDRILAEMRRVTAPGGHVFFSEEPVKQIINFGFWRRDYNLTTFEKLLKKLFILPFLSKLGGSESKYNVIENEFSLSTWKKALKDFNNLLVILEPVFWGPRSSFKTAKNYWPINPLTKILIGIEGGGITALAEIKKGQKSARKVNILDLLVCPECTKKLVKNDTKLICLSCKTQYPIRNNVIMLLKPTLRKRLYPNFE